MIETNEKVIKRAQAQIVELRASVEREAETAENWEAKAALLKDATR
jgi:hypothetical protein